MINEEDKKNDEKIIKDIKKQEQHKIFVNKLHIDNSLVYAKINYSDNGEVIISLINEYMLDVDIDYFKDTKNSKDDYYLPYVYEFLVDDLKEIKKIDKLIKNDKYIQDNWIQAKFIKKYDTKLINKDEYVYGTKIFSASPFQIERYVLVFLKEEMMINKSIEDKIKLIDELWDTFYQKVMLHNVEDVKDKYADIIDKKYDSLTVYNVGQGNFVYLHANNNYYKVAFDVGIDIKCNNYNDNIEKLLPDAIILSHWDLDHILGIKLLKDNVMSISWLAPDIKELEGKSSLSARRLAAYLAKNEKLCMISKDFNNKNVFKGKYNELYKGSGTGKYSTINNNHGLLLKLCMNGFDVILPGDCEYSAWPQKISFFKNKYDVMVLPHHGGSMLKKINKDVKPYMLGIVSYGEGNNYKHPSGDMLLFLKDYYNCDVIGTVKCKYIKVKFENNYIKVVTLLNDNKKNEKIIFSNEDCYHVVNTNDSIFDVRNVKGRKHSI